MAELFIKGLIVHLVVDFFLQSDWLSENKKQIGHPAAWLHSALHLLGYLLVFSLPIAIGLALSHLVLDVRRPLVWWRKLFSQNPQGEDARTFYLLQDQAAHVILLGVAAILSS